MFAVNLNAPFNHLQAVVPHFIKQGGGQIVGVSSLAAKLAKAYRSSYAGSKHGFLGFLDSLRS
jgi:short-subunit dehydrogenase